MSIQRKATKLVATGAFLIASSFSTTGMAYVNQIDPMLDILAHDQIKELQSTSHLAEDIWGRLTNEFVTQYESGDYTQAAATAQLAYSIAEKSFGPEHVNTADSLLKLGIITDSMGNSGLAKEYLLGALTILEENLTPNHVDIAVVLTNIANVYFAEGNNVKSEEFHQRALKIRQLNLGTNDATVAQSMYNLAVLYDDIGEYDHAAQLYEKAVEIWLDTLGANHPYVANALNNLANVYISKGDLALAAQLHQHSLKIRRKLYGNNHPEVARSIINLASLYVKDSDYSHAEPLYEEAVDLSQKILGPSHPQVAMLLYSLANVYHIQGRMDQMPDADENGNVGAAVIDNENGKIQKASLSNTKSSKPEKDYFQLALPLYERALEIFDNSMEADHPAITAMLNELAMLYKSVGKPKMAEEVLARLSHQH